MTIRLLALSAVILQVASCGTPPAPETPIGPAQPVAPAASDSASAASSPTPPPAATSSTEDKGRPPQGVGMRQADWTPASDGVDGWLQSKGIQDTSSESLIKLTGLPESVRVECDRVVPVGKPVGEAALCRRQYKESMWVLATSFLLLVPDNGQLRKLWEVPSAAGLLSRRDVSETPFVQLNVSLQDDGMELYLEEAEGLGCGDWRARVAASRKDAEPEEKDTYTSLERLAARVCQGKGRYAWRGSTFRR